ncbi:hypothetical protein WMY93_020908 [Mugilogobius chulae]|uniref:Protein-serine/threonine phosphatase n=1 Tax=Mugilogobius chulae TaxID=88201 RepID=A0AAW0N976_9GOBI
MEELREMECPVLKRLLKDEAGARKVLILDCRSFLAFSAGHIRGAVNARCNTIVRRRAKGSVLSLEQVLAGDEEVRARLRSGMYSAAVLYDERTPDLDAVKDDATVTLVCNALCRDSAGALVYLLKGGYDRFFAEYPEFCLTTKSFQSSLTSQSSLDSACSSCGTPQHDQAVRWRSFPSCTSAALFTSSKKELLDSIGISRWLNVSADCPNHFEGAYQYKCIPVEDNTRRTSAADSVRDSSGRVLVHCQAGISRSATICLAYLMKRKRVRLDEAFEFVRRRRSIISPNFSFMGQLLQFESQLLATSCAAEAAATASPLLAPKSAANTSAAPRPPRRSSSAFPCPW